MRKRRSLSLTLVLAAVCAAGSGKLCAQYVWDGGHASQNKWSFQQNWNPNNNAPVNNGTADLVFAGTTRLTPDSAGDWNINSITFSSTAGAFTLSGGTLTLQGASVAAAILNEDLDTQTINHALVLGSSQTWRTNAGTLVFGSTVSLEAYNLTMDGSGSIVANGAIAGTGALVKTGTGTLTLSGANTYSGGTTVSGGTLQGNATSLQGNIANNAALVFDQATGGTYAGVVSGSGSFTKQGVGTLTLSGANSYTGSTTISSGTLSLGAGGALADTTAVTVASGATFELAAASETVGSIAGAGNIALSSYSLTSGGTNASSTFSGAITGTGGLVKTGTGTLTLSGANTYSGGTTVSGGTLQGNATSLQGNIANNAALVFDQATGGTYAGVVSGSGSFTKQGAGTLTLSGANTYTGSTTISTGTLSLGAGGGLADTTAVTVASGATFELAAASETVGSIAGAGNIALSNNTLTSGGTNASSTFSGAITGTGGLVKTGTGTLTLSGANTYSGGTTVSGGTLQGNATSLQGNIANSATLIFDQATGGTYAGVVTGSGSLTKQGAGTLTLSGANTYSGSTIVSAGTLAVGANNALSSASALSLSGGTELNLGGAYSVRVGTFSYDNATLDYGTPGSANAFLFSQAGTGTGILTVNNWESGTDVLAFASGNTPGTSFIENIYFSGIGSGTLGATGQTVSGYTGMWDFITANAGSFFTWDGGGTNNSFNTAANWATNVAPTSGTGTKVAMAGTTRLTPNLNVDYTLNSLKFDSTAGSFSFTASAGRKFTFDGVVPSIIQASANAQTVNVPLLLNKSTFVETTGAGNLTLSGIISGTGGLTKLGTGGSLLLNGANTYSGVTTINEGTVVARNSAALGSTAGGTSVAAGAVLELQNNITVGAESLALDGTLRSNSGTNTYGGAISGAGAVTVGGGTLTLSGSGANSFTGGATVSAGSLVLAKTAGTTALAGPVTIGDGSGVASSAIVQLTNANQIADTAAVTLLADGRLNLNNQSDTIGSLATASTVANVQLGSGTLTTGGDNTSTTFAGVIAGTGGLTKTGAGTLTLTGTNTYTGATNLTGGTLALGASNALASTTNLTIGSGATLDLGGTSSNRVANFSFNDGVLDFGADGTANNFLFSDDGTAAGTLTIRNWNSTTDILGVATNAIDQLFLDSTFFAGIGVGIGAELSTTTQAVGSYGNFYTIRPIETFTWDGGNTSGNLADQDNWSKGGNWAGNVAPATSAGKAIVMAGIIKTANDMDGAYTIHSLLFNSDAGAFTTSSSTGDTLTIRGGGLYNQSTATQTLAVPIALAANQVWNAAEGDLLISGSSLLNGTSELTLAGGHDITISAAIEAGSGAIIKTGTGTLTLAGANTYTGATTVSEGTLLATNSSALGSTAGGTTVAAGAVLELQNSASIGAEALALDGTLRSNSGANAYGGAISGTGVVTVGGGSLTLSGTTANTYTGATTVNDGSLILAKTAGTTAVSGALTIGDSSGAASSAIVQLTNANQIADTTVVTLLADGRLDLNGQNETVGSLGSAAAAANIQLGAGTLTTGGDNSSTTFAGVIAGSGGLTKAGTGTFTLTGANTYTGTTSVNAGTLLLGATGVIADTSAVNVGATGVLDLNKRTETVGSIAGAGSILIGTGQLIAGADNTSTAFSGTLTGDSTAILTKNGTGTLTIAGDFNAGAADFAGTVNLNAGGLAFDVDNAFTGTLNVFAGTTLRLSDAILSVANLNFTGSGTITLDFSGTSSLSVEHLTIAAGITINVINWTNATDYFYTQNWAGAVPEVRGDSPMNQVVFADFTANDTKWQWYDQQVTPVPEPSTYGALLLAAVTGLLGYRRWRAGRQPRG